MIREGGAEGGEHESFGVPAEGVFEEEGEFAVSVRDGDAGVCVCGGGEGGNRGGERVGGS